MADINNKIHIHLHIHIFKNIVIIKIPNFNQSKTSFIHHLNDVKLSQSLLDTVKYGCTYYSFAFSIGTKW